MRFKSSNTPPPYLNKRDQIRLLKLVALLSLVLITMRVAANPDHYRWMWELDEQTNSDSDPPEKTDRGKPADFDVRLDRTIPLRPDEFISPKDPEPDRPPENAVVNETAPSNAADSPQPVGVELDKRMLSPIQDNILGITNEEIDLLYSVLSRARSIPLSDLEHAASDDVDFSVLMKLADHFRGDLITVEGEMRRLRKKTVPKNRHGIETRYDAWLFTSDSGNNPYHIVCTSVPEGIPSGENIAQRTKVRATGYFFKLEAYATEGGELHSSPLLVAKRLRWYPPRVAKHEEFDWARYVVGFFILLAVVLGMILWRLSVTDKRFHEQHMKRITAAPAEAIEALSNVQTTDVNEMFRELSRQHKTNDQPIKLPDAADSSKKNKNTDATGPASAGE